MPKNRTPGTSALRLGGLAAALVATLIAVVFFSSPDAASAARSHPRRRSLTEDADCGGTASLSTSSGTLHCVFDDEFSGSSLNSARWHVLTTAKTGYHSGTDACFVDTPQNVSVSGGELRLTALALDEPLTCSEPHGSFTAGYSTGSVSSYGLFARAYGVFSIRAKFPAATVPGLQSSLWLWPADISTYGVNSGEIDIAEQYTKYADRVIPYLHYRASWLPTAADSPVSDDGVTGTNVVTADYCMLGGGTAFHTYTAVWTPGYIQILYDGHNCLTDHYTAAFPLAGNQPFDQPFFLNLTQALGIGKNAFDPDTTPLPATTQIDWVRVWG